MNNLRQAENLIKSLYLGDRYVKSIALDGEKQELRITVDLISRVNPATGNWDFYDKEDIENGVIVFRNVKAFATNQQGCIANDGIYSITCEQCEKYPDALMFTVELSGVDTAAETHQIELSVVAQSIDVVAP